MKYKLRIKTGFTLIELVVAVGISVIIMLSAASLFMIMLVSNTKTSTNQSVRNEGEYALQQMEFLLRNAIDIQPNQFLETCQTDMSEIKFLSLDGGVTTLSQVLDDNDVPRIASNSSNFLTSESVELTSGPTFNCYQSSDLSNTYINFSFTLKKNALSFNQNENATEETFMTGVGIRSQ